MPESDLHPCESRASSGTAKNQHRPARDEVEIQCRADYDRVNGPPDPLNANNSIQEAELREMHDRELQHRAWYDQDNNVVDDLYIVPMAHDSGSDSGAINNFPAFSRHLRTMRYLKEFKSAIEKYDSQSDPGIWLKMYNITAQASGGNKDHMAGYFPS